MSWDLILSKTVNMPKAGVIKVTGVAVQGFPSGAKQWGFQLYIDSDLLFAPQGNSLEVALPLLAINSVAAGSRTIQLYWSAESGVTLHTAQLTIEGFNNAAGV